MGCPKKGATYAGGGWVFGSEVLWASAIAQQIAALISGCKRSEVALPGPFVSHWYVWWIALNTFKLKRRSKRNELWELARRLPQGWPSPAGGVLGGGGGVVLVHIGADWFGSAKVEPMLDLNAF